MSQGNGKDYIKIYSGLLRTKLGVSLFNFYLIPSIKQIVGNFQEATYFQKQCYRKPANYLVNVQM